MSFELPDIAALSGQIQKLRTQGESIGNKRKRLQFWKSIQAAETAVTVLESALEDIRKILA